MHAGLASTRHCLVHIVSTSWHREYEGCQCRPVSTFDHSKNTVRNSTKCRLGHVFTASFSWQSGRLLTCGLVCHFTRAPVFVLRATCQVEMCSGAASSGAASSSGAGSGAAGRGRASGGRGRGRAGRGRGVEPEKACVLVGPRYFRKLLYTRNIDTYVYIYIYI